LPGFFSCRSGGPLGIALALVDLLFVLFVSVQFRYLFGGSSLVEVTPGLTYAEYVRQGFEQLALACALVLPSLLAADWLLQARRVRDTVVFRVLGGLLLLLLVVIIASALQRGACLPGGVRADRFALLWGRLSRVADVSHRLVRCDRPAGPT
jgi:hypothetical protein